MDIDPETESAFWVPHLPRTQDVSLLIKLCAQRKAGKRQRARRTYMTVLLAAI